MMADLINRYFGRPERRGNEDATDGGKRTKEAEQEGLGAFTRSTSHSAETVSFMVEASA